MPTGNLVNLIYERSANPAPIVGDGATILSWSDRHAGTIIEVANGGKTITVQEDLVTRMDSNGLSDAQSYDYERNPNGSTTIFTLRKNGRWVTQGESMRGGRGVSLGVRDHYFDYSF